MDDLHLIESESVADAFLAGLDLDRILHKRISRRRTRESRPVSKAQRERRAQREMQAWTGNKKGLEEVLALIEEVRTLYSDLLAVEFSDDDWNLVDYSKGDDVGQGPNDGWCIVELNEDE